MKISFADRRPDGEYALVLPVAGKDRSSLASLGAAEQTMVGALDRQRFEGDASAVAEQFVDDGGTCGGSCWCGMGTGSATKEAAEKLGGTAVARLSTSGEKQRRHRREQPRLRCGCGRARRLGRSASFVAIRPVPDEAQGQAEADTGRGHHRRRREGRSKALSRRWAPVYEGVSLTRELVTEPANIIYPETFVERVRKSVEGSGVEIEVLDRAAMEKLGMGALLGVAQGSAREARMLVMRWNGGVKAGSRSHSSARE